MNISNVPISGGSYTLEYSFSDGGNSRSVTVSVDSSSSSWLSASVNSSTRLISITVRANSDNQRTGTITPVVDGSSCTLNTISVSQDGSSPTPPSGVFTYPQLREQFNAILTARGKNALVEGSGVDNYLSGSYETAIAEYAKTNSKYFDKSTYEEVFTDGRSQWGSNSEYESNGFALNAMTSWLMAMQLAELVPDSGVSTNTQTELYAAAYNTFQPNNYAWSIPLYNNYTLKGDPAITRLVAGALYSKIRSNYTFNQIDSFKSSLGGQVINNPYANSSLGWVEDAYQGAPYCLSYSRRIGYGVNANLVIPPAPGPYVSANGWCEECATLELTLRQQLSNRTYCKEADSNGTGHCSHGRLDSRVSSSYFNSNHNYKIDDDVDSYVTTNYNLRENCSSFKGRTVQAIADANEEVTHLFANLTYYKHGVNADGCYNGSFIAGSPDDNNGYIKGVFNCGVTGKDLSTLWGSGTGESAISKFFGRIHYGVSSLRATSLFDQFGRMRPCAANPSGNDKQPRSTSNFDLNNLSDSSIELLGLGTTQYDANGTPYHYYVDTNGNGVRADWYDGATLVYEPQYNPNETPPAAYCYTGAAGMRAHTYPSGHNAGCWTITMLMMEFLPNKAEGIYKAGYSYGVSRTIVRAHWNSDTMYGKFIAMMNVPVYHSVDTINSSRKKDGDLIPIESYTGRFKVREGFTNAKNVIAAASSSCNIGEEITIQVRVKNNLSSSVSLSNQMTFYLANPDASGNYYGDGGTYHGCYNRNPDPGRYTFSSSPTVSVAGNGGTTSYYSITLSGSADWGGVRAFAPNLTVTSCISGHKGPATLYDSSDTSTSIQDKLGVTTKVESDAGYKVAITFYGGSTVQCEKIVDGGKYTITIY